MDLWQHKYAEGPLVKTKIVATVGPASASYEKLTELVHAGVDVFRLNFAHGKYDWFQQVVGWIRQVSADNKQPIAILDCGVGTGRRWNSFARWNRGDWISSPARMNN